MISLVKEFSWNDTAFDALVMETKLKTRLGSLVKAYGKKAPDVSGFDDFIREKGLGLIGLLFGKPGLGKTFTAEAIAEMARLPLMTVSAGSLGSVPDTIEENLRATLDLAARWRAVVLFDEADVFLAKRDSANINAVVSVFLRELEYFPGIMLLTTNKKDLIDEAFQSRIHFCHSYPELDFQARVKIWKEFVMRTQNQTDLRVDINNKGYEHLAREPYNGREIKNIMSMASMSALDRTPPILTTDDILEISRTLQNWNAVSVEDRSSATTSTAVQNTKTSVFAHMPDRGNQVASISTIKSVGTWVLIGILAVGMMHNALLQLLSAYRRD
ncbi:Cell division cycle protein [Pseudocercospora fuligena]|uniref:Cell division cycle protein n=1 Tax=Pseudocercospora fuligena TaxID=685502 RepID=A0A8H6R925_9PEZI|nr:Cell division cycle protein [Pseudocercospora fuligena]